MKKLLALIAVVGLGFQSFAFDPVNEKLLESFKTSFPHAEQVKWQELPASFVVTFMEETIRARAYYDKDGELVQLIRYYKDTQLPFAVLHAIQKQFSGKTIFGVVEVTSTDSKKAIETVYHVKLEDGRNWTTVRIDISGHAVITQKIRKA
jgi:hypothetical protein